MPERFDHVVVGAGSAGCVLAGRLTEDPTCRVLLLEAGTADRGLAVRIPAAFPKLFRTARDWNYRTAPEPALGGRALYWPRGKMLGGSSSMNAQMYVRGHRADYDRWKDLGNTGWGFDGVLPFFARAEGALTIGDLRDPNPTTRAFVRAAMETGIPPLEDAKGAEPEGVTVARVTQRRGRRWSAADAYLRPALRRPNLTVRAGAHVTRVLVEGRRAAGVEYRRAGERAVAHAEREVILAGGAVNSPQLLMLSGIGPGDALRALGIEVCRHLPGVGANLQDHLAIAVIVRCPEPVSLVAAESLANLARYLVFRRGMLTSNVGEAYALVRTRPDVAAPDLELIFAPVPFMEHGLVKPPGHGLTIGLVLLQPRSRGVVELESPDPLAPPRIRPGYLSDPDGEDLGTLVEGLRLARRVFRAPALARYVGAELEPGSEVATDLALAAFVRQKAETLYHPVGTCRMGIDDLAVVDPELRVQGVDGLRVVDASVMPVIIRGHTHAPTVMIAEKAAALIARSPGG